jgi:hypothetical protein
VAPEALACWPEANTGEAASARNSASAARLFSAKVFAIMAQMYHIAAGLQRELGRCSLAADILRSVPYGNERVFTSPVEAKA